MQSTCIDVHLDDGKSEKRRQKGCIQVEKGGGGEGGVVDKQVKR